MSVCPVCKGLVTAHDDIEWRGAWPYHAACSIAAARGAAMALRRLVVLESPYRGDIGQNERYARRCLMDSIKRGEAPLAGHLLYPQVLDDQDPQERAIGLEIDLRWLSRADALVVYQDNGVSNGMKLAIKRAEELGVDVEYRSLAGEEKDADKNSDSDA